MATLIPETFDQTLTVSVDGADCPTYCVVVTGVEIAGVFTAAEDTSMRSRDVVHVAVSLREVTGFRFVPCGCARPALTEAP